MPATHLIARQPAGAVLYEVEYRATVDGSGPWVAAAPTGDTAYVLTGLDTNQEYQARVLARSLFQPDPPNAPDAWSGADGADAAASDIVTATPVDPLSVAPGAPRVAWVQDTQVMSRGRARTGGRLALRAPFG